jgi:hypothetical protein
MKASKLHKWITDWVEQLDKNKKCPYAKPTVDKNKMKSVMLNSIDAYHFWSSVSNEAEQFDDTYDVVIVAMDTDETIITPQQMQGGVDSFNAGYNNRNIDLWCLNLYNELYTMVLLQRVSKLDDASKVFEKKDYYKDQHPYMFNKHIVTRRNMRKRLTKT